MGFQHGLSGLQAASTSLNVIGNNVANASTVGFKESRAEFADVYARALNGGAASQVGIGVAVSRVAQQFFQGNISTTNNVLDIAINGSGFFRMSNNGAISYARNGQFELTKDGFIENANGHKLTGYAMVNGVLATGAPTELNISMADVPPKITSQVNTLLNLDSRAPEIAIAFDINNPLSYTEGTAINVYDSLGNSHVFQTYYVRTSNVAPSTWDVYGASDGVVLNAGVALGTLEFNTDGSLNTGGSMAVSFDPLGGATNPLAFNIDFAGTTQYGSKFGVNSNKQDGYTSGRLDGFTINDEGTIMGSYTNGQTAPLGQIVLANFANPNGLEILGNNEWAESLASGAALVGVPTSGSLGNLRAYAQEDSNVDLTTELINMITAQRVYQANAQTIKTEDQIMQTLVNLR